MEAETRDDELAEVARDTFEGTLTRLRAEYVERFARHEVTETGPYEWRCARPGTGNDSFRVIVRHSMVCIYGDLGEGIFRGGEAGSRTVEYTLEWLGEAAHKPHYLCEKLRPARQEFYPGDALARARESAEGGSRGWKTFCREVEDAARDGELHDTSWRRIVSEYAPCYDVYEAGFNHDGNTLLLVEALRWLVEHLPVKARAEVAG